MVERSRLRRKKPMFDPAAPTFGLPECLRIPIAAANIDAIEKYVGNKERNVQHRVDQLARAHATDYTGFGSFLQIDGGEVLQGSIGASGGIPLHLRTWDNCRLTRTPAIGVSVSPIDLAGGFTYTFQRSARE